MALKVEGVLNGGMHAEETLSGSSRFEPLHLALSSPLDAVRILEHGLLGCTRLQFVADSLVERAGFEPSVSRRHLGRYR
jgi:hypothetical protein